jgi:hypothetical protein
MKINFAVLIFGFLITFLYALFNTIFRINDDRMIAIKFSLDGNVPLPNIWWNNFIYRDFLTHFDFVLISFYLLEGIKNGYFFSFSLVLLIKSFISFHILEDNLLEPDRTSRFNIIVLSIFTFLLSINYIYIFETWDFMKKYLFSCLFK